MPRTTASKCDFSVAPRRLKDSSRLRLAQEIQRTRSALALAGLFLDIGKISVPITILAKPARLTSPERHFITRHVRRGLYMVRAAEAISEPLEEALLGHHERLDGSGYPRGIRGTHLPLAARLAGIVDTYDALLQTRSYSPAIVMSTAEPSARR